MTVECQRRKATSNLKKIFIVISFFIFFTLLYVELSENGLTSSGLGSVILSLVAPTIVFLVTLKIKHQVEFYFKPSKSKDQPNDDEQAASAQDCHQKLSVNTPLLNQQ